jgi:hypothetical protein
MRPIQLLYALAIAATGVTAARASENATGMLSAVQRGAIGDEIRSCWIYYNHGQGTPGASVEIRVVTNASGIVQLAEVAPADQKRVDADPALQTLAMNAVRTLLDFRCDTLPLPANLEGASHVFTFRFSP